MIDAYDVATIRALEAEAIAEVGEDTLMQRAASGVAAAVARDPATTAATRSSPVPGWLAAERR
jgi:NAD(P)H-hydrate repair Nnr-like enzyme with NAD(P)H-hydrate epimerase domain